MPTTLHALLDAGQSPWVDYLARPFVRDGDLARLVDAGIRGVTSNPTIFQGAMAEGDAYDDQLRDLVADVTDPKELFLRLAVPDVRSAADILRPVFDADPTGRDGWVSLEVDPNLAHDTVATFAEARRLADLVDRPNLYVKIPGTEEGIAAIEETIAHGIPVNVTLLFSLDRHRAAAGAYLRGLRRFADSGGDLRSVGSVASFFVSRVDSEADRRLVEVGGPAELRGTLALANARLAFQQSRQLFAGPEWTELSAAGATPQRCLWASTSMKDESRRDVDYVEGLILPDTVDTMPTATVRAFLEHGRVDLAGPSDFVAARRTLTRFAEVGVDYEEVVAMLEREGVAKFADSFRELFDGIDAKRRSLIRT
ncbi:MAG TPA: transaldolase [Pseudonocardiaceae bacterium]|jgi:transaldolase|nr:transaldolase [Pseudonocardiaceae bacterium]